MTHCNISMREKKKITQEKQEDEIKKITPSSLNMTLLSGILLSAAIMDLDSKSLRHVKTDVKSWARHYNLAFC